MNGDVLGAAADLLGAAPAVEVLAARRVIAHHAEHCTRHDPASLRHLVQLLGRTVDEDLGAAAVELATELELASCAV